MRLVDGKGSRLDSLTIQRPPARRISGAGSSRSASAPQAPPSIPVAMPEYQKAPGSIRVRLWLAAAGDFEMRVAGTEEEDVGGHGRSENKSF